jgi:hypothetical protein
VNDGRTSRSSKARSCYWTSSYVEVAGLVA